MVAGQGMMRFEMRLSGYEIILISQSAESLVLLLPANEAAG